MRVFNSFFCPGCTRDFPLFARGTQVIRNGPFRWPYFRCSRCSLLSGVRVHWVDAMWAWPVTIMLLSVMVEFKEVSGLRHSTGFMLVYGAIGGLVIGIGFRRGCRLQPLFSNADTRESSEPEARAERRTGSDDAPHAASEAAPDGTPEHVEDEVTSRR